MLKVRKVSSEAAAFKKETSLCEVMYGFRMYNQDFRSASSKQSYTTALQYPNLYYAVYYAVYYTDATGATASSSSSKYYTWYHQTPPYNCYADKESSIRLRLTTAHVTATSALI